jgi:hypothetical protein
MLCPYCNDKELMVNGMNPETGAITYVCWNPKCEMYKRAFYATGGEADRLIKDQQEAAK